MPATSKKPKHSQEDEDSLIHVSDKLLQSTKKKALKRALPDPGNLTPRTSYAAKLLGLQRSDYDHARENWSYPASSDERRLEEYYFYRHLQLTLQRLTEKRNHIISRHLLDTDIEARRKQLAAESIQSSLTNYRSQLAAQHANRNRQFQRYLAEKRQQLALRHRLQEQQHQESLKQQRKALEAKRYEDELLKKRNAERAKLQSIIENEERARMDALWSSAQWHLSLENEMTQKHFNQTMTASAFNEKRGSDFRDFQRENAQYLRELDATIREQRATIAEEDEELARRHAERLRGISDHFKHKVSERANKAEQVLKGVRQEQELRDARLQAKIAADERRMEQLELARTAAAMEKRREKNEQIRHVTEAAKQGRRDELERYFANMESAEKRRQEFQAELKRQRELKKLQRGLVKANVTGLREQGARAKDFENEVIESELKASDDRHRQQEVLRDVFFRQRQSNEDEERFVDDEYRSKIEEALKYDDLELMEKLMEEYQKREEDNQAQQMAISVQDVRQELDHVMSKKVGV